MVLGAAMLITAFPVLARIITENNLQKTRLGTLALTCAAVDDVTAWCLLAIAIALGARGAIALNNQQPTAVYPLSLIEFSEDYAFESTPVEANRLIEERRQQLEELINTLEPPSTRSYVHPIIRISSNVARETAKIAELEPS
jgi:Sodium/hydrogen exchanger family